MGRKITLIGPDKCFQKEKRKKGSEKYLVLL
jgi:hypothetical protein